MMMKLRGVGALVVSVLLCFVQAAQLIPKQVRTRPYVKLLKQAKPYNRVMFFDLDDTLYRRSTGVVDQMKHVMGEYISEHVLMTKNIQAAQQKADEYYTKYGLTVKGILAERPDLDPREFEKYVDSNLKLQEALKKNDQVLEMLNKMKGVRKWVLTNAGWTHAERTLKLLGLQDEFEGIIHSDYLERPNITVKPEDRAYERAMEVVGEASGGYYFADDNPKFVEKARTHGWHAALVNESCAKSGEGTIKYIEDLPTVFPELFNGN